MALFWRTTTIDFYFYDKPHRMNQICTTAEQHLGKQNTREGAGTAGNFFEALQILKLKLGIK